MACWEALKAPYFDLSCTASCARGRGFHACSERRNRPFLGTVIAHVRTGVKWNRWKDREWGRWVEFRSWSMAGKFLKGKICTCSLNPPPNLLSLLPFLPRPGRARGAGRGVRLSRRLRPTGQGVSGGSVLIPGNIGFYSVCQNIF